MRSMPARARLYILCAALAGAACAAPAPSGPAPWPAVALLAVLYAGSERTAAPRGRACGLGTFYP
ncbi:metal-dependent phosphohydrolase, partial [Streptomyces sp. G44]|nr:metal-dependent phosphohydrolase [Streptomyces sp. G44]